MGRIIVFAVGTFALLHILFYVVLPALRAVAGWFQ